jgi:hypothetical protein
MTHNSLSVCSAGGSSPRDDGWPDEHSTWRRGEHLLHLQPYHLLQDKDVISTDKAAALTEVAPPKLLRLQFLLVQLFCIQIKSENQMSYLDRTGHSA